MAETLIEKVAKKIDEYNLGILTEYPTEDKGYCFISNGMIIFVDEEDETLSVAFQADQKPEDVASNTLILNEIDNLDGIYILESFLYDKNNNYISGKAAHDSLKDSIALQVYQKVAKHQIYNNILETTKCFNC